MFFLTPAVLAFVLISTQTTHGSPTPLSNNVTTADKLLSTTSLVTSIPKDFTIKREFALPLRFSHESCYINIIAALCDITALDFESKMHPKNYRTNRFPSPIIKIAMHGQPDAPRRYIIWGLFLIAFYLRSHEEFMLGYFALQWQGDEIAGVGLGATDPRAESITTPSWPVGSLTAGRQLGVAFEYFGSKDFGPDAVYLTIIAALTKAAPSDLKDRITETWISFLNNEACILVLVPTPAARTSASQFLYEDLSGILAKTSDYFADHRRYSPLSMNITVNGVEVAKATLTSRFGAHGPSLSATA
ncbi:MAG: hypothetical protein Q9182_004681 [Xanthomendoza sp. 2 TL-2023]